MISSFSYRSSRLQGCLQTLLTTDLLAHLFFLIALYFGIAAAFSFVLNSFVPGGVDPKWLRAMDGVTLIVGFVYYIWIKDAMDGYTSAPTLYRNMLNRIATFCDKYAALHGKFKDLGTIREVRDACIAIIFIGYKLFDPGQDEDDEDSLMQTKREMNITSEDVIWTATRGKDDNRSTHFILRDLIMVIASKVKKAADDEAIRSGDVESLTHVLDDILKMVEEIDTGTNIPSPGIFKTHILFTLFIYFGVWLPFYFWGTIGVEGTLFVYPLTMFILTGIPLYRTWLGDPFDQSRPIHLIEYADWKDEFRDRINHTFGLIDPEHKHPNVYGQRQPYQGYNRIPPVEDALFYNA